MIWFKVLKELEEIKMNCSSKPSIIRLLVFEGRSFEDDQWKSLDCRLHSPGEIGYIFFLTVEEVCTVNMQRI